MVGHIIQGTWEMQVKAPVWESIGIMFLVAYSQKGRAFTCSDVIVAFPVIPPYPIEWAFNFTKSSQGTHCSPLDHYRVGSGLTTSRMADRVKEVWTWVGMLKLVTGRKAFLSNTAWKAAGSTPCWSNPEQVMVKLSPLLVERRDCERSASTGVWEVFLHRETTGVMGEMSGLLLPGPGSLGWAGRQMVEVDEVSRVSAPSSIPLSLCLHKTCLNVYANSVLTTTF